MKKSREQLENDLENSILFVMQGKKAIRLNAMKAKAKYDMPEKISTDYLTKRKSLTEAEPFALFIIAELLLDPTILREYYTDQEIEGYSKAKWPTESFSFPIEFNMTQIRDDQYIGKVSVKTLMALKDAQMINYNENAQRTMKHIVKGEFEYYQIALNKEAVSAIMDSYYSDLYIPNTITLNLPEDALYSYDPRKGKLLIRSASHFDILDGYHRYIAMSKIHAQVPDFNYDMELRIVQFPEGKAKRFIWQEDQKTKMRKVDSDSMNSAKAANKIVEKLNSDPSFILSGQISRNKGIINAAYLADVIDAILLSDVKKADELQAIMRNTGMLKHAIEWLALLRPEYLTQPWDKKFIFTFIYELKYSEKGIDNLDDNEIMTDYYKVAADDSIYAAPNLTKADITRTHKLLGKEGY